MIRITVVTITYNAAGVLQRTLDSLLRQDYAYVEHVVVDGASKDQTVKMVEAYQTQGGGHASRLDGAPEVRNPTADFMTP